jgi:hypothetical protein
VQTIAQIRNLLKTENPKVTPTEPKKIPDLAARKLLQELTRPVTQVEVKNPTTGLALEGPMTMEAAANCLQNQMLNAGISPTFGHPEGETDRTQQMDPESRERLRALTARAGIVSPKRKIRSKRLTPKMRARLEKERKRDRLKALKAKEKTVAGPETT